MTGDATRFADPYLVCDQCGRRVTGYSRLTLTLVPCGHIGATSVCPSWSPVDGCRCELHLGHVPHPADPKDLPS